MAARKERSQEQNSKLKRAASEVPLRERMYSTWYRFRYGEFLPVERPFREIGRESREDAIDRVMTTATCSYVAGWQFQTSVPSESKPIWLLGKCYFPTDIKAKGT